MLASDAGKEIYSRFHVPLKIAASMSTTVSGITMS
jgi:hypothetical protein